MLGGIGWRKTLCPRTVQTGKPCWPTKEPYHNGGAVEPVVSYGRFHERGVEMATSWWVARSTSGTGSVETQKRYYQGGIGCRSAINNTALNVDASCARGAFILNM